MALPDDVFLNSSDFGDDKKLYPNKVMKGLRYRLLYDKYQLLQEGVDWFKLPNGGFQLDKLEVKGDATLVLQFY